MGLVSGKRIERERYELIRFLRIIERDTILGSSSE